MNPAVFPLRRALSCTAFGIALATALGCAESDPMTPSSGAGAGGIAGGAGISAGMSAAGSSGSAAAGAGSAGMAAAGAGGMSAAGMAAAGIAAAGMGGAAGSASGASPTFTRVWAEILMGKGCAGEFCHGAGAGGLSMDNKADAYMNLVGKTAAGPLCGMSGLVRVKANDPTASLLLQKMTGPVPPCGELMPVGVRFEPDCLSPTASVCTTARELQLVRDWIMAGAMNN